MPQAGYEAVPDRIRDWLENIRRWEHLYGRTPGSVQLLAVSKTHPAAAIRRAREVAGQRLFGESYPQEAVQKITALAGLDLEWHFIGPLQSNKTRQVAAHFHWVHSLERVKIAERLARQRPGDMPPLQVCLQVNISAETSKSGVTPEALPALAREVLSMDSLCLRGLMAIPAASDDPQQQRQVFAAMAALRDRLQQDLGQPLDTLSMGMSGDAEMAVAEGATIIRVGTGIFGERS